jgi:hypothetical protein
VPFNKETLVKTTEETVQAQATIFSGGTKKADDDDEDDEVGTLTRPHPTQIYE